MVLVRKIGFYLLGMDADGKHQSNKNTQRYPLHTTFAIYNIHIYICIILILSSKNSKKMNAFFMQNLQLELNIV